MVSTIVQMKSKMLSSLTSLMKYTQNISQVHPKRTTQGNCKNLQRHCKNRRRSAGTNNGNTNSTAETTRNIRLRDNLRPVIQELFSQLAQPTLHKTNSLNHILPYEDRIVDPVFQHILCSAIGPGTDLNNTFLCNKLLIKGGNPQQDKSLQSKYCAKKQLHQKI